MNLYDFYENNTDRKAIDEGLMTLLFSMPSTEAAKLPPPGLKGDSPVTIHIGGREERWNSRWLCYRYYRRGAMECDGSSEGDRYWQIVAGLIEDMPIPSDDVPLRSKSA